MQPLLVFITGALLSLSAAAADLGVSISDAWGRASVPGQTSGSVQFSINSTQEAKLISISSPSASAVEIHHMVHEGGKMKMRALDFISLPAGKTIELGKSGNHVMLIDLKQPLKVGDSVPLMLTIEFGDKHKVKVNAKAEIRSQNSSHEMHDMGDMGDMHNMGDMHDMKGM